MATYLTLDARYGVTSFDPSNGYPILTTQSELIDDSTVLDILTIASLQVPPVFVLVSDYPITDPTQGVPAVDYITQAELDLAISGFVAVYPQSFTPDQEAQARANLDAAEDTGIGAVRYDIDQSGTLTDAQKAQARTNIGAGTGSGGGGGGSSALAVPGYISVYDPSLPHVAVGDGVADDTAALNAAETYALTNNYKGVDLGSGIFKITGPVKFSTAVRGSGGNENPYACVIRCASATASVQIGYSGPPVDTVHARVTTGFVVDINGSGDPAGRFQLYNIKGIVMDVNVTDLSFSGTTVSACAPGHAIWVNGAQNVECIQMNSSAVQGAALLIDNGAGGNAFKNCHPTTAGTLLRITDLSPGSSNTGFPFGPASNAFDSCIFETRLADTVQLILAECGSMNMFQNCQFSVSTSTGILTSGAMVNVTGDIIFKGLNAPFATHLAFGDGNTWNGGAKGAYNGTNPLNLVAVNGAQTVDFSGVHYVQDAQYVAYNLAGAGTVRLAMTGLLTGGGYANTRTGATSALSDSKQAIAVGTGVTSYTLTFGAQTTAAIGPADTAASIQTKLQALSSIGSGNILVTGENGVYMAHFTGSKAGSAQAAITTTPTGGTVTITQVQTGGVTPSLAGYTNALNTLRVAGDFSRTVHYTTVTAGMAFIADVSAYPEIQFNYVNSGSTLATFSLINANDGQIFTITHVQSTQGESTYVWPSNCVFRGPTPFDRSANGVLTVTFRYYKALDTWYEESRSGNRQIDLPYWIGPVQHAYDPASGGYNINSATMHSLRAKLAATLHGDSDTHIFFFGDSMLGGYGGTTYAYDTCVPRSAGRAITAKQGAQWVQGIQYAVGDKSRVADNWTLTGSFGTGQTMTLASIFLFGNGAGTATRSALPGETGTAVDVYYSDLGTNGIPWKIDGVSQTALPTSNTNTIRKTTVTGLTLGAHTIQIAPTAGQNVELVGTRIYNPAVKSVHIHNLSIGGSCAASSTNDLNWSSQSSSGTYGAGWVMEHLITASGITPDFIVMSLGGNDINAGTSVPTVLAGLQTVWGYYAAPGMILHGHKVSGLVDSTYHTLGQGKMQLADTLTRSMFNWDDWIGGLAVATADGLIGADGTHPTAVLQTMGGTKLGELLSK